MFLDAAFLLVASLIPTPEGPSVPYLDKAAHLCAYWLFAWLLVQAIRLTRLRARDYLLMAWTYATAYGLLIEVLQGLVPWRSADLADAAANALGAALGVLLGSRFPSHP